jgi:hypothetical protein
MAYEMDISKEAFIIPRTPQELAQYVNDAYEYICAHHELVKAARLKREPYKTFAEELVPFSAFCCWKYGDRNDVLCSLAPGTKGHDAVVKDQTTGTEHEVEITWPIDGRQMIFDARQLNTHGHTEPNIWDIHDLSEHTKALSNTLEKVRRNKGIRDYRSPGGSTLIIVFDEEPLFWEDNPQHAYLLHNFAADLRQMELKVDNLLVMFMPKKRIVVVRSTESANEATPDTQCA